jgi:Fe-S-cluster containining protein
MDLIEFRKRASRKKGKLKEFLLKLDEVVPEGMPKLVAEASAEVWTKVNCMECANCCKTMTPTYNRADIKRIATHFGMTSQEFKDKWLEQEEEGKGDWMNKSKPCQFLGKDNKCTIYEIRPKDCAEFPHHHHTKQFDLYTETYIDNLAHCPATFMLVESLKKTVEREFVWD